MNECRLGYYFARCKDSDKITIVSCWGERIIKEVNEDVEILEPVPKKILGSKTKILNLQSIRERS